MLLGCRPRLPLQHHSQHHSLHRRCASTTYAQLTEHLCCRGWGKMAMLLSCLLAWLTSAPWLDMITLAVMGVWAAAPQLLRHGAHGTCTLSPSHHGCVSNSDRVITTAAATDNNNYRCLTITLWLVMASTALPNTETHCAGSGRAATHRVGSASVAARRPASSQWLWGLARGAPCFFATGRLPQGCGVKA